MYDRLQWQEEGGWDGIGVPPSVHMYVYMYDGCLAWHGMLHTVL